MNRTNSTISENIYTQIEAHLADVTAEARLKGQQCGLHQDIIDIILQDYANILQDTFAQSNMTPTYTQKILACPEWLQYMEDTGVMFGLLQDYKATLKTIETIKEQYTAQGFRDISDKKAYNTFIQYAQTYAGTTAAAYNALLYFGRRIEAAAQRAVIYLHVHSIITLRQTFITTNEEMLRIKPANVPNYIQNILQEYNGQILKVTPEKAKDAEKKVQSKAGKRTAHATAETDTEPELLQPESVEQAGIRRNMIKAISEEIEIAQKDEFTDGADAGSALPLLASIARETGVTDTYAMQALEFIATAPTIKKPNYKSVDFNTYTFTIGECLQRTFGNYNPSTEQLQNFGRALQFYSSRFIKLTEYRKKTKRNKNGTIEYIGAFKPFTTITPIIHVKFTQEVSGIELQEDLSGISKNAIVELEIHKTIAEGRRKAFEGDEFIRQEKCIWLSYRQMQAFTTPDEIKFLAMLFNKSHIKELAKFDETATADILAEVFQYKARLKRCKTEDEQKKMHESIRKHRTRDKDRLKQLFAKAKELGILSSFECVPSANGKDMVWKWKANAYNGTQDTEDIQEITEQ